MIHHVSIPARDPRHVAAVLAELLGGTVTGFGPYRGSYVVWVGDDLGTAIETYPTGTELLPDTGSGQANFRHRDSGSPYSATHVALSTERSEEEILACAEREGWRAIRLPRGPNDVIEFWIENTVMLELMTQQMARDYVAGVRRLVAARGPAAPHT